MYALAWQKIQDSLCPCGCGHPIAETTNPDNEDRYTGHAVLCFAGQAKAAAAQAVTDKDGLLVYATKDG